VAPAQGQRAPARTVDSPKAEAPTSNVEVAVRDQVVVLLTVTLIDQAANARLFKERIAKLVLEMKGYMDMVVADPRIHELAQAISTYAKVNQGQFPRGTVERPLSSTRAGRPYPPDERVSWLSDLLPFLGPEQASLRINREKSCR